MIERAIDAYWTATDRVGRVISSARIRPEIIEAFEKMRPTTKDPAS